ncbi:MAG: hypothetical protein QM697_08260 [Lachnospiraceae bacterium]
MIKNRTHRVGTLTLGITLVVSGIAFLVRLFVPALTYYTIMKAWPIVFIFLGIEVLFSAAHASDDTCPVIYDKSAIFITAMLILFAMCIGSLTLLMERNAQFTL